MPILVWMVMVVIIEHTQYQYDEFSMDGGGCHHQTTYMAHAKTQYQYANFSMDGDGGHH